MTKQQLQLFVQGPLQVLNQSRYAQMLDVQDLQYKTCAYHDWGVRLEADGWLPFDRSRGFGGREYHALFKTALKVPPSWMGGKVRLKVETGSSDIWNFNNPQFLVYLNYKLSCGFDVRHTEVDLPDMEDVELVLYCYVSSEKQDVFLDVSIYLVNEELEAFVYDLGLAYETAMTVEYDSEAYITLSKACIEAVKAVDFSSLKALQNVSMLTKARAVLSQILSSGTSPSKAKVAVVGHSHIDMAWLWTVDQTREKGIRSYATVLSLMEQYPDYVFSSSQMQLLAFIKADMPSLYDRIKARIDEGRWEVEGGMWVESDTILTSGESLVRQFYWGKKWMRDEYGKESVVLWLPDCFGFPATLPQIMKGAGISYFVTTKLGWNETNRFPHDVFAWQGLDGSRVLSYLVSTTDYESLASYPKKTSNETTYNGVLTPSQILGTRQRFQDKALCSSNLHLYGYGDGGGGPTKQMLENHQRMKTGLPGLPKTYSSTVRSFLDTVRNEVPDPPVWAGELYLEYHRGTYTTMAEVKRLNRLCEQKAFASEFFCCLAWALDGKQRYPHQSFEAAWKLLALNQFHDILPGSSIKEVYETTIPQLTQITTTFDEAASQARSFLASNIAKAAEDVVVFNTLDFVRNDLCTIEAASYCSIHDETGRRLPSCKQGSKLHFIACKVPSKGWKRYRLGNEHAESESPFSWAEPNLSTPYYEATFAKDGSLARLYDKQQRREVFAQGKRGNVLSLSVDLPKEFDAWNIGKQGALMQYALDGEVRYRVLSCSEVGITLEGTWTWLKSTYRQRITFGAHSKRIDFNLHVDWREDHLMLRTAFDVDVRAMRASYDIAFGVCERSTHTNTSWDEVQFEVPAHKWVDLSEKTHGVALLSKQSYGYSAKGNTLTLSLLRAPTYPSPQADRGEHDFSYALLPHAGGYEQGKVIEEGYALHQSLIAERSEQVCDKLDDHFSLVEATGDGVVIETIKKCEERASLILRLISMAGRDGVCTLRSALAVKQVWICNLVEERLEQLSVAGQMVEIAMKGHEIVSVELVLNDE